MYCGYTHPVALNLDIVKYESFGSFCLRWCIIPVLPMYRYPQYKLNVGSVPVWLSLYSTHIEIYQYIVSLGKEWFEKITQQS